MSTGLAGGRAAGAVPVQAPGRSAPGHDPALWRWLPPVVAVAAVGLGLALGWHGVDVAASVHRIDLFRRHGWTLWDDSWYGGQWTLDYSVLFAPLAAALGLPLLSLLAAVVATVAFQDLAARAAPRVGAGAVLAAALVLAVGNLVQTSIGQLPYLTGEAAGLAALALAARRRWVAAWLLAAACSLLAPLAGLFLGLAAAAWWLATVRLRGARLPVVRLPVVRLPVVRLPGRGSGPPAGRRARLAPGLLALGAAAAAPVLATAALFPGEGRFPFSVTDCAWYVVIAAALWLAAPRALRVVRTGMVLYAAALVACLLVPSPIGGNVGRLDDALALPVATLVLWSRRRLVLGVLAVPLILSSWVPALDAMHHGRAAPSTTAPFYRPLDTWLARVDPGGTRGRVEVVPTFYHWESVYVAGVEPLARGWERQHDVTGNPLFYRPGPIPAPAYRRWLLRTGVGWVALPSTRIDLGGTAEAALLRRGVPGLQLAWQDRRWRVYRVRGAAGLTAGDGRVTRLGAASVTVRTAAAGPLTIRVRDNNDWRLPAGRGCLTRAPGGWVELHAPRAEAVTLQVAMAGRSAACRGRG